MIKNEQVCFILTTLLHFMYMYSRPWKIIFFHKNNNCHGLSFAFELQNIAQLFINYKRQLRTNVRNDIHTYKRGIYICGKDLKGIKDVSMHKPKLKKVHSLFLSPLFYTFFYNCKYFFLLSPENSSQFLAFDPVIFLV